MKNKTTKQKRKPREWMAWAYTGKGMRCSPMQLANEKIVAVSMANGLHGECFRVKIVEVLDADTP